MILLHLYNRAVVSLCGKGRRFPYLGACDFRFPAERGKGCNDDVGTGNIFKAGMFKPQAVAKT